MQMSASGAAFPPPGFGDVAPADVTPDSMKLLM